MEFTELILRGGRLISQATETPLKRLLMLIDELAPFLDSEGRVYCYTRSEDEGVVTDLDGEVALALLSYRYHATHKEVPARSEIRQALDLVRGKLWDKRPPRQSLNPMWDATSTAIEEAVRANGDFLGSAAEALKLLQKSTRTKPKIFRELPRSADQLGVVLVRIGLLLRGRNIELFRPPRRDRERLWCWRELTRDQDTSDTADTTSQSESEGSDRSKLEKKLLDDAHDTFTAVEAELFQICQGGQS